MSSCRLVGLIAMVAVFAAAEGLAASPPAPPATPRYIGVLVAPDRGGMRVTGCMRDSSAAALATRGGLKAGDVVFQLGNYKTRTLTELSAARRLVPNDQAAKMVLRRPNGSEYHLWLMGSDDPTDLLAAGDEGMGERPNYRDPMEVMPSNGMIEAVDESYPAPPAPAAEAPPPDGVPDPTEL